MPEEHIHPRETADWSLETLFAHLTAMVGEVDRRYEQRFEAQEEAIAAAFAAADRAIQEADRRYEQRFSAQEAAVNKAEAATEKRFDGVNEFRSQLADQASTFMPRQEAVQRADTNAEKITGLERRLADGLANINSRLDLMAGRDRGEVEQRTERRDSTTAIYAAIGVGITILLAVVAVAGLVLANGGTK